MTIFDVVREQVSIYDVMRDYLGEVVPTEVAWQIACPFSSEHRHADVMKSARIYPESNSIACFAYHGLIDGVEIVARTQGISRPAAAAELFHRYHVEESRPNYRKAWDKLQGKVAVSDSGGRALYSDMYEALMSWCKAQPGWWPACLPHLDPCITELLDMYAEVWPTPAVPNAEARVWLERSKTRMRMLCSNYGRFNDTDYSQPNDNQEYSEVAGLRDDHRSG